MQNQNLPAYTFHKVFEPAPKQSFKVDRHYLLYAQTGAMRLEADGRSWFLPPARAALICADHKIEITILQKMTVCSVLFSPDFVEIPTAPLSVFEMSPLARELVLACRTYTQDMPELSEMAAQLFTTLSRVTWKSSQNPSLAFMPIGRSQHVRAALEVIKSDVAAEHSFMQIANQLGTGPRTLARKFSDELGMTWSGARRRLRMMQAMEFLTDEARSITDIAFSVGYASNSAFNAAFRDFTGQNPTQFRDSFRQV